MDIADAARAAMNGAEMARDLESRTKGWLDARGGLSSTDAIFQWGQDALQHIMNVRPGILDDILKQKTMDEAVTYLKGENAKTLASSIPKEKQRLADIPHDPQEFYNVVNPVGQQMRFISDNNYLTTPFQYQMYMNKHLEEQLRKLQGYSTLRNSTREDLYPILNQLTDRSGTDSIDYNVLQSHLNIMKNMTPEQQNIYMILIEGNPDINIAEAADMARNI